MHVVNSFLCKSGHTGMHMMHAGQSFYVFHDGEDLRLSELSLKNKNLKKKAWDCYFNQRAFMIKNRKGV